MSGLSELLPNRGPAAERLLLREFSHRVNDAFASAIDLVTRAASRCDSWEARVAVVAALDRLQNQALVHRTLQLPEYDTAVDVASYLHQLCRAISRAELAEARVELVLSVYPLRLSTDRCWLLGMIVFELIGHAARRVVPNGAGSIHLEVSPAGGSTECCISSSGTAVDEPPGDERLAIIDALVVNLRGTLGCRPGPDGTRTTVKLPVE
jgi:two-component sensor histidine kinase